MTYTAAVDHNCALSSPLRPRDHDLRSPNLSQTDLHFKIGVEGSHGRDGGANLRVGQDVADADRQPDIASKGFGHASHIDSLEHAADRLLLLFGSRQPLSRF